MDIIKYNAICNLGCNIDEIFANAINGICKEGFCVDFELPQISNDDFNLRCNRLLLKVLKPLEIEKLNKEKTAIVVATTNSGVEEYETSKNPKHFQIGNPAEFIHNYFGFKNFYTSVSTACSSGIKAFSIAKELLDSKIAETIIVASVDSLAKVPTYGFDSLEILSKERSLPFSKNRCGINIGEGAAAFLVKQNDGNIKVHGIGETTDFYHSTTPDPEGIEAKRAIKLALGKLKPEEIDYINLHGTGTPANDLMEANAIFNIFGDKVPTSSTKPLTGHCLGAAAGIETALCCKLLEENGNAVFPHIYDGEYDTTIQKIWLADKTTRQNVKTCLSTSFGFGGTNCAIVLRRNCNV